MLWSLTKLVRVGQLHQVDHFWANVEPRSSVWELIVRAIFVYIEPCIQNWFLFLYVIHINTNHASAGSFTAQRQ